MRLSSRGQAHQRHTVFIVTDLTSNRPLLHIHAAGHTEDEQFQAVEQLLMLDLPVSISAVLCYCHLGGPRLTPAPEGARVVHTPPRLLGSN